MHRNYFIIYLHEGMGQSRNQTCDPWICSQTRNCSQTHYQLRYAVQIGSFLNTNLFSTICLFCDFCFYGLEYQNFITVNYTFFMYMNIPFESLAIAHEWILASQESLVLTSEI